MKLRKTMLVILATVVALFGIIYAADHADTPALTGKSTDITDLYVFRGQNHDNLVFVGNSQGLLSPSATRLARFDEKSMLELNIDNNGDNIEDLVIQCLFNNGKMYVYGPVQPSKPGLTSRVEKAVPLIVDITKYHQSPSICSFNGITAFAGPRDDPFFFDLDQFKKVLAGEASSFNTKGVDHFAGTNVMSVVIEVPKRMLGSAKGSLNVWLETKRRKY